MTFPGTKVRVAKKQYECADCDRPIKPSDEYVPVNEYGEQRKLHRSCGELRRGAGVVDLMAKLQASLAKGKTR